MRPRQRSVADAASRERNGASRKEVLRRSGGRSRTEGTAGPKHRALWSGS